MSRSSFRLKPRLHLKGLNESASPLLRRREISESQAGSASSLNLGKSKQETHDNNINEGNNNCDDDSNVNDGNGDHNNNYGNDGGAKPRIIYNHLFANDSHSEVAVPLCELCKEPCGNDSSDVICDGGERWHPQCFACAQCFRPFQDGIFYEFEGRKYCEYDFQTLFAPCCAKCKKFITGRVIRAMKVSWHPDCFCCSICAKNLSDEGFARLSGSPVCRECNLRERAAGSGRHVCYKCHQIIDEPHLVHKGETFHPYHFNCSSCNAELTASARETGGRLLCLRCHDKNGMPICGACRRPIEDRVVTALGKQWHVEHFVCAKCEKPFLGTRHYEKRGLAYCELHYHQLYGNICYSCNGVISGDVLTALNKTWCAEHFSCAFCDSILTRKSKFYELDLRPVCKNCYSRFPAELRNRLKRTHDLSSKGSKKR